jgi:hypothetical protein
VASFGAPLVAVFLISPQPVREPGHRPGLRSVMEGLRYVRGKQAIEGAYLIDINAMVLAGLQIAVVTGGPRIGDLEAGAVAAGFGNTVSVVSGGLACIAGALLLARALPGFRRQRMDPVHHEAAAPAA